MVPWLRTSELKQLHPLGTGNDHVEYVADGHRGGERQQAADRSDQEHRQHVAPDMPHAETDEIQAVQLAKMVIDQANVIRVTAQRLQRRVPSRHPIQIEATTEGFGQQFAR